jgi:tryptophanyl-tRNA synthetase
MDLQDPTKKMSKSDADQSGCILLADNVDVISRKIKRAVTDSGTVVEAGDDKPALTNLLAIYSLISGKEVSEIVADYVGRGYGDFKSDLADLVVGAIAPLQGTHDKYMADAVAIDAVLARGREFAQGVAGAKIYAVKQRIGLV